jgi:hypothetical protein
MASAMASGSPITGAALMFAFVLGTSPIFFVVAYFATQLGSRLEKYFMKFVAVVVLILAFVTINTGLNLLGSPFSFERIFQRTSAVQANSDTPVSASLLPIPQNTDGSTSGCNCGMMKNRKGGLGSGALLTSPTAEPTAPATAEQNSGWNDVTVNVLSSSYSPDVVRIKAGLPTRLTLVSKDVFSCSLAFVIPTQNIQVVMDPTDTETIELPAFSSGDQIPFSCSMGMFTGIIIVE